MSSWVGRHFALIELDSGKVLQRFPVEKRDGMAVLMQERRLRAEHSVDDPTSGLALRDSALDEMP